MASGPRRTRLRRGRLDTTTSGLSGLWESGIFDLEDDVDEADGTCCMRDGTPFTESDSLPSSFYSEQPHLQRALENDPQRKYKISVIKDLLRNFSLEETVAHYKALPACSFTVTPANFSYDCATSARKLRDRLLSLTGSDEMTINDPFQAEKLRKKLDLEYESQLDRADECRAEGERDRLLRLMERGVITPDEMHIGDMKNNSPPRADMHNRPPCRCASSSPRRTSRRFASPTRNSVGSVPISPKVRHRSWNVINMLTSAQASSSPRKRATQMKLAPQRVPLATTTAVEPPLSAAWLPALRPPYSQGPGLQASSPILGRQSPKYDDYDQWRKLHPHEGHSAFLKRYSSSSDRSPQIKSRSGSSRLSRRSRSSKERYEHPLVTEMKHVETVNGLYEIADELYPQKRRQIKKYL